VAGSGRLDLVHCLNRLWGGAATPEQFYDVHGDATDLGWLSVA
jgi:hypothetical protein